MSSYLKYLSNNYCCPARVQHSSDTAFEVKEFTYFVMEARYVDMSEFFTGSIIHCQMNGSNIKHRGSLIRGQASDSTVRIPRNYESCVGNIWMRMKTEKLTYWGLLHSNILQHIFISEIPSRIEHNTNIKKFGIDL